MDEAEDRFPMWMLTRFPCWPGAAYGRETDDGHMPLGAFIEYGKGSYNSYNSFVRGDGDAWDIGAGILGRMDFKNQD